MEGKPRKPFADLTNKLSAVSITDIQGRKDREGSSSSLKLSAVSLSSLDVSKPRKAEKGSKTKIFVDTEKKTDKKVDGEKEKKGEKKTDKKVDGEKEKQGEKKTDKKVDGEKEKPKKVDVEKKSDKKVKMRPANLDLSEASKVEDHEVSHEVSSYLVPPLQGSPFTTQPGAFFYLGAPSNEGFQLMSPFPFPPPSLPHPQYHGSQGQDSVAYVSEQGYISLKMSHGIVLDIANDMSVRLVNPRQESRVAMSGDGQQVAIIHPQARALLYQPRVEIQVQDDVNVKNAKIYPQGISFTASNLALVYRLDQAGARSTTDTFHDLATTDIVANLFDHCCLSQESSVSVSSQQLERTRYWRSQKNVDCWVIGDLFIQQAPDGFVIVDKKVNGPRIYLQASPGNGKIKLGNSHIQASASLGQESHFYLRSGTSRLHYSGTSRVFTVRSFAHSAGFDEEGGLRIF